MELTVLQYALSAVAGSLVGFSLGLVGGGGSILAVPLMVYLELQQKGILRDKAAMRKWLNSDEARPYRTHWMTS